MEAESRCGEGGQKGRFTEGQGGCPDEPLGYWTC